MKETSFDLPTKEDQIIALINSVPDEWASIRGQLTASKQMRATNTVAMGVNLVLRRRETEPTVHGELYKERVWKKRKADMFALFVERKFPEHISLDDAGYENSPRSVSEIKDLLCAWLEIGYHGKIQFIAGFVDDNAYSYTGSVTFFLEGRRKTDTNSNRLKSSYYKAALTIKGNDELLLPILDLVDLFGLKPNTHEYDIIEPMESLIPGLKEFRKKRDLEKAQKDSGEGGQIC
jgi:hypothetical protein